MPSFSIVVIFDFSWPLPQIVDDGPNALGQSMVRTTADMILRNTPRAVPTSNYLSQSQSAYPPAYPAAHTWNTSINAAGPDIEVSQINKVRPLGNPGRRVEELKICGTILEREERRKCLALNSSKKGGGDRTGAICTKISKEA
jgi:hypothetical protein